MTRIYSAHGQPLGRTEFRSPPAGGTGLDKNISENERIYSLAGGIGLGLAGLARGGLSGLALTAIGAGLAWRGYTGHCHGYAALGNQQRRAQSIYRGSRTTGR